MDWFDIDCCVEDDCYENKHIQHVRQKSAEASTAARQKGNKLYTSNHHDKKMHLEILSHYSESVALANSGSEELALAYSNRSALLQHLRKYEECLVDIERAHQITKSDELKMKLLVRKMKCMNLMDTSTDEKDHPSADDNNEVKSIEYYAAGERSETIPCACDCVTLAYNKKYGRHLVATKDIEPGQVVIIEKSSVQFAKGDKTYLVCSHCLTFVCNGIPCESCAVAMYCSKKCRKEAWLQYHDVECIVLPFLMYADYRQEYNLTTFMAAIRLFIKSVKKEGLDTIIQDVHEINRLQSKDEFLQGFFDNGVFQSQKLKTILNLSYNERPITEKEILTKFIINTLELLSNFTNIFDSNISYSSLESLNETKLFVANEIIYKLVLILDSNIYKFQGSNCNCSSFEECKNVCGELDIGSIFLPFSSLINHSCYFNVNRVFADNQEIFIFTVQPIKKGEQLFISYGATMSMKKIDRQQKIKQSHHFICDCVACKENWSTDLMSNVLSDNYNKLKLLSEFEKIDGIEEVHAVLSAKNDDKFANKSVTINIIKMIQIVYETLTGYKACLHSFLLRPWITKHYEKVLGVKIFDIPSDC